MRSEKLVLVLVLLSWLTACTNEKPHLPEAKGLPCEMLVVMSSALLNTDIADTVATIVDCDAPGLGSSERIFRSMTIGERGYEKVYKAMHSQLKIELAPGQKQPVLGVANDVYARSQLQILVRAGSLADLRSFLSQQRELIQRLVLDFQLDRYAAMLRQKYSKKVDADLQRLGYRVNVPTDIASTKKGKNFLWGSSNRGGEKDINFVFYTYPWYGEEIADTARFVFKRDSVLRANIPGSQPNQWMQTARGEQGQPVVWPSLRKVGDHQRLEIRGLWELHNGFMGGPFVSYVQVDSIARQVVVCEGFVFSPNSAKRDLLRSMEASLRTLRKMDKGKDK